MADIVHIQVGGFAKIKADLVMWHTDTKTMEIVVACGLNYFEVLEITEEGIVIQTLDTFGSNQRMVCDPNLFDFV